MKNKQVKHPCIGCIYFKTCGEINRTTPCDGRMTRSEREAADRAEREKKQNNNKM